MQEKKQHLRRVAASYTVNFSASRDLVFIDTENDNRKWDLENMRELTYYDLQWRRWRIFNMTKVTIPSTHVKAKFLTTLPLGTVYKDPVFERDSDASEV